ncbi:hypothetical protein KBA73_03875 [Patescibacteria group bacterium]|nr:hypothetical protein [Patescibacteria group bacterium]
MKPTIVIFSNPFGYGPTGNAIPVIQSLLEQTTARIVFAGSAFCAEILPVLPIERVLLDERNEEVIERYLQTIDHPFVVGSQNRFCIAVAKRLRIPCAFIDTLAWFWKEIPSSHLEADEIFWVKFPGIERKLLPDTSIHLISSLLTPIPRSSEAVKDQLIIQLGGVSYPLREGLPTYYLEVLVAALNAFPSRRTYRRMIVAAGSQAILFLRARLTNPLFELHTFTKEAFVQELTQTAHLVTAAGISSTLEAFSAEIPTSFLLPLNLSQVALTDLLEPVGACPQQLTWETYVSVDEGLREMSERDALPEIERYAQLLQKNESVLTRFSHDLQEMCFAIPDQTGQEAFIRQLGDTGAQELVEILKKVWSL